MSTPSLGKRTPPPEVPPLVIQGIEYNVKTYIAKSWVFWSRWHCDVVATQKGKRLWSKEAYSLPIDQSMELDVQPIYPKSLTATMHEKPDAQGAYRIKGLDVVDEEGRHHYVPVNP